MKPPAKDAFFIGWARLPGSLIEPLLFMAATLVVGFAALSLAIGGTKPDPGDGAYRFDWGSQTVTGILLSRPSPTLLILEGTGRLPAGHTVMLTGSGKRGVVDRTEALASRKVRATGIVIKRGDLDMLELGGMDEALVRLEEAALEPPRDTSLGRWRLAGEICDGKCTAGAMRPGRGLAHKACANLCITGGVPPVFVLTAPVEGSDFLLLSGEDGGPPDTRMLDLVGRLVRLDGELVRRGDLLIFQADLTTADFPS